MPGTMLGFGCHQRLEHLALAAVVGGEVERDALFLDPDGGAGEQGFVVEQQFDGVALLELVLDSPERLAELDESPL